MATLNQFQQYSQGENTITNNVLLMFSLLYEINPKYYEEFINSLIDESAFYQVIPSFNQQFNNGGNGYIDGHISMPQSSIIIETKISGLEWIDKLLKYTESFFENETKILFHLSAARYSETQLNEINTKLSSNKKTGIKFFSITYEDLVDQLKSLYLEHTYDSQLERLSNHFESYCQNMGLLSSHKHTLRAMACGQSFDLNVKHKFYFDLAERGYSPFNYLGIYRWKRVKFIGKVENMIIADWNKEVGLIIKKSSKEVTSEQKERLIDAIIEADSKGWGVSENHRFFLLKDFTETNFVKTSPGGIFRVRYFNLMNYFEKKVPSEIEEIAEKLKTETWQ